MEQLPETKFNSSGETLLRGYTSGYTSSGYTSGVHFFLDTLPRQSEQTRQKLSSSGDINSAKTSSINSAKHLGEADPGELALLRTKLPRWSFRLERNDHSTILHELLGEARETADDIDSCTNSTPSGSIQPQLLNGCTRRICLSTVRRSVDIQPDYVADIPLCQNKQAK